MFLSLGHQLGQEDGFLGWFGSTGCLNLGFVICSFSSSVKFLNLSDAKFSLPLNKNCIICRIVVKAYM